jgi:hypothetical protein
MPDLDLEPYNWKSDREKPKEPILGPGWPAAVGWLISFAITVIVVYNVRGY